VDLVVIQRLGGGDQRGGGLVIAVKSGLAGTGCAGGLDRGFGRDRGGWTGGARAAGGEEQKLRR